MNWRNATCRAVLLILLGIPATARTQNIQESGEFWAIRGATLIDGTGGPAILDSVIVGRGEKIICASVAASCQTPEGATIIEAGGKFVIPGLIDTHVHLPIGGSAPFAQLTRFAFGITTTRDAGTPGTLERNLKWRTPSDLPTAPEPRLVVSALVSDENLRAYGAKDVADLVRKLAQGGADAIKIKKSFSQEELSAITKEAHANKLPVFGHAWGGKPPLTPALAAGIDGLSHMATFAMYGQQQDAAVPPQPDGIDAWVWESERWNYQDEGRLGDVIQTTVRQGVWIEPMLTREKHFTLSYPLPEGLDFLGDPPSVRAIVRPWIPLGDWGWTAVRNRRGKIDTAYRHICDFVSRFHTRGGIAITGTDDQAPGPGLIEEVGLLTECGFSAMEALQAATKHAAAALKRADLGTIEAGKTADLVILNKDPLLLPANLLQVWRVVKGGHLHDPAVLLNPQVSKYRDQLRRMRIELAASFLAVILLAATSFVVYGRFRHRKALANFSS